MGDWVRGGKAEGDWRANDEMSKKVCGGGVVECVILNSPYAVEIKKTANNNRETTIS